MPHTYSKLLTHVVWSTKDRMPSIAPDIRGDLLAYMGGIVREEGGTAVAIGGTADHVHLLIELPADRNVADCVRVVKTNSSRWVHEKWPDRRQFSWQAGYGAFAVSASNADRVVQYIRNQEEHHRRVNYHDEFVTLLRQHGIAFDEKYLWS
jgi:REP element-mobilizing transposase RayT